MDIKPQEIKYRSVIGRVGKDNVLEVGLKGGLHLIFLNKNGKLEPIGSGSHRALARHIANKKMDGKLEITELEKSEYINPEHFKDYIPYYEALTASLPTITLTLKK